MSRDSRIPSHTRPHTPTPTHPPTHTHPHPHPPTHLTHTQSLRGFSSPEEARLRAVYRDLWERGLTIGCGAPYGADFTAYEGGWVGGWGWARQGKRRGARVVFIRQGVLGPQARGAACCVRVCPVLFCSWNGMTARSTWFVGWWFMGAEHAGAKRRVRSGRQNKDYM